MKIKKGGSRKLTSLEKSLIKNWNLEPYAKEIKVKSVKFAQNEEKPIDKKQFELVSHKPPLPKKYRSQKKIELQKVQIINKQPPPPNIIASSKKRPDILFSNLGVLVIHPEHYVARFGDSLVPSSAMPEYVKSIKPINGEKLAADQEFVSYRLVGDVEALKLLDQRLISLNNVPHLYNSNLFQYASGPTPKEVLTLNKIQERSKLDNTTMENPFLSNLKNNYHSSFMKPKNFPVNYTYLGYNNRFR